MFYFQDIDWSRENLRPIQKDLYNEHPNVTARNQVRPRTFTGV